MFYYKISQCVFWRWTKVLWFWNSMRVSKLWQLFIFGLTNPLSVRKRESRIMCECWFCSIRTWLTLMLSSHCTVFKVIGSLLFSHCTTIWVAFSRCCFHIARWIGDRRFHTAWLYNKKSAPQTTAKRTREVKEIILTIKIIRSYRS